MSLPPIVLSINPLYRCNMRCEWCYLTKEQLSSRGVLDLDRLEEIILNIIREYELEHVDLYGGEITLLSHEYQRRLYEMLRFYNIPSINVVTNYTQPDSPILTYPNITLAVSYDFTSRNRHEEVLDNLMVSPVPVSILTLTSREFLDSVDVDDYVQTMNLINVRSLEIKPYSSNQANQQDIDYREYEQFVISVIDHPDRMFPITNESLIENVLLGKHNSYSDNHLYITPDGEMAVLDFDSDDNEYFSPVKDLDDYRKWTQREVVVTDHGLCITCKYRGNCLSEHLRVVTDLSKSCNGFYNLLENYSG